MLDSRSTRMPGFGAPGIGPQSNHITIDATLGDNARGGRVVQSIDEMGLADHTLVIYIVGDNGAGAEAGPEGALNLEGAMNGVVPTVEQVLPRIEGLGTWKAYNQFLSAGPLPWTHHSSGPSKSLLTTGR